MSAFLSGLAVLDLADRRRGVLGIGAVARDVGEIAVGRGEGPKIFDVAGKPVSF